MSPAIQFEIVRARQPVLPIAPTALLPKRSAAYGRASRIAEAARITVETLMASLADSPDIEKVYLVCRGQEIHEAYLAAMKDPELSFP